MIIPLINKNEVSLKSKFIYDLVKMQLDYKILLKIETHSVFYV